MKLLITLKKRQQFVNVKTYGKSWATEHFVVQGLLISPSKFIKPDQEKNPLSNNSQLTNQVADVDQFDNTSLPIIKKNIDNTCVYNIGFTASKRLGNAVKRNRAKRRLREVCRLNTHLFIQENIHYVFIARSKILTCGYDDLQQSLKWSLKHLHRIIEKRPEL